MNSHISSEKKLQLVRKIREEHQMNRDTVRGREAFLYGRNVPYESFQDAGMDGMQDGELPVSTFRLRTAAALLLFAFFYTAFSQNKTIFGLDTQQVYESVETDYSPILFDFMEQIPYTLHE